eukprot:767137-Hanusia_phi.AAC.18
MQLVYHTAGMPFTPPSPSLACLDPAFTHSCARKSAGWVTLNKASPSAGGVQTACIRTAKGNGICWPGGKTGYNLNSYLNG